MNPIAKDYKSKPVKQDDQDLRRHRNHREASHTGIGDRQNQKALRPGNGNNAEETGAGIHQRRTSGNTGGGRVVVVGGPHHGSL